MGPFVVHRNLFVFRSWIGTRGRGSFSLFFKIVSFGHRNFFVHFFFHQNSSIRSNLGSVFGSKWHLFNRPWHAVPVDTLEQYTRFHCVTYWRTITILPLCHLLCRHLLRDVYTLCHVLGHIYGACMNISFNLILFTFLFSKKLEICPFQNFATVNRLWFIFTKKIIMASQYSKLTHCDIDIMRINHSMLTLYYIMSKIADYFPHWSGKCSVLRCVQHLLSERLRLSA